MRKSDEAKLVESARDGDLKAFDILVDRYKDIVYGMAYYRLRNFEDARDVAQEAFVNAYLHLNFLSDEAKFAPWLKRITTNACTMHQRKYRPTEPLDIFLAEPDSTKHIISQLAVQEVLRLLSEDVRLTLTLYYFHSYSTQEVALFLSVPVTTIKSRLRDGRARLKKEMILMMEETVNKEPLNPDFNKLVLAIIQASINGDLPRVQELLEMDSSLVHSIGEVDGEHMRRANAHNGWTPLHLAAHFGHTEIVKLLVQHGADLEAIAQNSIGNTPISAAAYGERLDIVSYLLDQGANINAPNKWGSTALHRAIECDHPRAAEFLLQKGADRHLRDDRGRTPLVIAEEGNNQVLIDLLKTD